MSEKARTHILLCLCLIVSFRFWVVMSAAQDRSGNLASGKSPVPEDYIAQSGAPRSPVGATPQQQSQAPDTDKDKQRREYPRGSFVIAPLPIVSPAIGS